MALRLGFDMDGVLADFRTAFRELAVSVLHHDADGHDAESTTLSAGELNRVWKAIEKSHNWWVTLQPYEPQQIARLYRLARQGSWEVSFLTKRPPSGGDSVQFQTQWWLEQHGYPMPAVVTVPGSRGELANALRLDLVVDDQIVNCAEIVSASTAKTVLLLRDREPPALRDHALARGIGVVPSLEEAITLIERLQEVLPKRRGRLSRLADWFLAGQGEGPPLAVPSPRPWEREKPQPGGSEAGPAPGTADDPAKVEQR
jgi:hypothetical protein